MSYGLEVINEGGKVVCSTDYPNLVCIYSGDVNGEFNFGGLRDSDIMCFTYLDGGYRFYGKFFSGGVSGSADMNSRPVRPVALGRHRVAIFRENVTNNTNTFGLEVYDSNGKINYTSNNYPIVFANSFESAKYPSLLFQGFHMEYRDYFEGEGGFYTDVYSTVYFTNPVNKSIQSRRMYLTSWRDGGGTSDFSIRSPHTPIDLSHIPHYYSTGLIWRT